MKEKSIRIRLSQKRYDKLKAHAENREKTVTQLVEDWIDKLQSPKVVDNSYTPLVLSGVETFPNQSND